MTDFEKELEKYGFDQKTYEQLLTDIDGKINGENDYDWSELKDKYNVKCNPDTIRKGSSTIFGGKFRTEYLKTKMASENGKNSGAINPELDAKIQEMRKERIKLQTANIERSRLDKVNLVKRCILNT